MTRLPLEGLAELATLAERNGKAPSDYLRTLNDTTDPIGYWRWCVDRACEVVQNYLAWKRERDAKLKAMGYEAVVSA